MVNQTEPMPTHHIVRMQRSVTQNGSVMWRCTCNNGDRVNIFRRTQEDGTLASPKLDSSHFFYQAGYQDVLDGMVMDQVIEWKSYPVGVVLQKTYDGKFWDILACCTRPDGAEPDGQAAPDKDIFRLKAVHWAKWIISKNVDVKWWDTETSGKDADAEIVSIAIGGGEYLPSDDIPTWLIRPQHPERLYNVTGPKTPSDVHGITPEMLERAATFEQTYLTLKSQLDGRLWVIYNSDFDTAMLEQECIRHRVRPIVSTGINCAMRAFAEFNGEWDAIHRKFVPKTLSWAAESLGISVDNAHDAGGDVSTMMRVVLAMADSI